tara:strand:- start:109 stop:288 length:180 start_codon:yes stop_codon:yes gene_type:complete
MFIMLAVFFSYSIGFHNNANICSLKLKVEYGSIANKTSNTKVALYKRGQQRAGTAPLDL